MQLRIILLPAIISLCGCAQLSPFGSPRLSPELKGAAAALNRGDSAQAAAQIDAYLRGKPRDAVAYINVAQLCTRKGRGELAVKYAEQGIAATTKDETRERAQLYMIASVGYELMGDTENEIRTARESYQMLPDDPQAMNGLGYAYAQAGQNLDEALRLTTKAVELARKANMPDEIIGVIEDSLGWAQFRLGNTDDALRYLTHAADLAPDEWEIHEHLSQVYTTMGKAKDAAIERDRATHMREATRGRDD